MKKSLIIASVLIGAVLLGTGYALWNIVGVKGSIVISGIVEADDIHVGSKIGGRVLKVVARRGQTVKAGEVLVLLEPRDLDASLAEAQAAMRQAQAKLALLTAGYREEEIEQAEAAMKQSQAELSQLVAGPRQQEIDQARADWLAAKAQAENSRKLQRRMEDLSRRDLIAKQDFDDAQAKAEESEQKMKSARERYDLVLAGTRTEEIERARQRLAETEAKLRQLKRGFRKEEVAQAKSEVEAARARVELIRSQLDETVIKAPVDAVVEVLDLEPGDLVGAGKPMATLLRINSLWVRAYLPEAKLGFVKTGAKVTVRVDSFPNRDFAGIVRRVSRQAEFTPRNVQTWEERVLQVFQTDVVIDDPDHILRPGMNADVTIPKN
ncbi:MAG: HlyD family efflux transporter periplasmic adaptor subunit [Deltaproteobacteria bacterium]|nr:HlyD family efflux transporter periplasmic adaptor subunit [Deltaproteobacteria bacterium]